MAQAQQEEIAARIRELRGPRPQPYIADKVGVTLRALQRWESGHGGIAWQNIERLAEVFGVSTNYLLYGEAEPHGPQTQLDRIEALLRRLVEAQVEGELREASQQAEKRKRGNGAAGGGSARRRRK